MRITVRYQVGTYQGEKTVNAEDEDEAIAKVRAWCRREAPLPAIRYESYAVVDEFRKRAR